MNAGTMPVWLIFICLILLIGLLIIGFIYNMRCNAEYNQDRRDYLLLKKAGIVTCWGQYDRLKQDYDKFIEDKLWEAEKIAQDKKDDEFLSTYSDEDNAMRLKKLKAKYEVLNT